MRDDSDVSVVCVKLRVTARDVLHVVSRPRHLGK